MAKGFKKEDSTPKKKNYKTIFEKIKEKTNGEEKSWSWYRQALKTMATKYKKDPELLQREERRDMKDKKDEQDENHLRKYPRIGRLFFFEYKPKMKYLPYYDAYPLVYVIHISGDAFIGANLHYLHPKKRVYVIQKLHEGRVDIPRVCFHKYLLDQVDGYLLDLASAEWETAISLPVEHFVKNKNGVITTYKPSDVWTETSKYWSDRLKLKRIIRGYGNPTDITEVT